MKKFCMGFIFDLRQERVLLIKKRATDPYNPNKWNGVGGKIERNETSVDAMIRETKEEVNLSIPINDWFHDCFITDDNQYIIDVFFAISDINKAEALTDENIHRFTRKELSTLKTGSLVKMVLEKWLKGEKLISNEKILSNIIKF